MRPNEYHVLALGLCFWIVHNFYNWLPPYLPIPADFYTFGLVGTILVSPFLWWLWMRKWRVDPLLKAVILPTLWFCSALIPYWLRDHLTGLTKDQLSVIFFLILAEGVWRPSHCWFTLVLVTGLWAWLMPGWGQLEGELVWQFFTWLLLPFFLYFWVIRTSREESKLILEVKGRLSPWAVKPIRMLNLALYLAIFYLAVDLTLHQTVLKHLSPSPYLLQSAELSSIFGWLAMAALTFALFLIPPLLFA